MEYSTSLLYFLKGTCAYQKNTSDMQVEYSIVYQEKASLFYAIENTVANIIDATYAWRSMGRLGVKYLRLYNGFRFLFSYWLHFIWHGTNLDILIQYLVENMLVIVSFLHLIGSFNLHVPSHHSCWRPGRESSGRRQDYYL